jgi:hypothetical protein
MVEQVEEAARAYVEENEAYPNSLDEIGLPESLESGPVSTIAITDEGFELTLRSDHMKVDGQTIVVGAYRQEDGSIGWQCAGGTLEHKYRPVRCRPGS